MEHVDRLLMLAHRFMRTEISNRWRDDQARSMLLFPLVLNIGKLYFYENAKNTCELKSHTNISLRLIAQKIHRKSVAYTQKRMS